MQPRWFWLLDEQRHGKGITARGPATTGRIGLTLSFLVGALRTPPGTVLNRETSLAEFHALLESMRDYSSGLLVRIYECGDLHQPLACLADATSGSLGDPILLPDGSPSRLYAWPQYFARDSRDVESLAAGLWRILEPSICEGRFSYRTGTYQEFNADDLEFIRRAFARDDDA